MCVGAQGHDNVMRDVLCSVGTYGMKQPYWQGLLLGPNCPDWENLSLEGKEKRFLFLSPSPGLHK